MAAIGKKRKGVAHWLSRDPIGELGGINLYGYVGNMPMSRIDPLGLWYWNDPSTWFDGGGFEGTGNYSNWRGEDFEQAAYAAIDGIIPFADPFDHRYDKCDDLMKFSKGMGALSRDLALASAIPNIGMWARNPVLYEAGSATVPNRVFSIIEGLNPVWRGRWLRSFGSTFGPYTSAEMAQAYAATWNTGLTPGGRLFGLGLMELADSLMRMTNEMEGCP